MCYANEEKLSILPCLIVETRLELYDEGVELFPYMFKMGGQYKMTLWNFGNLALKWEVIN